MVIKNARSKVTIDMILYTTINWFFSNGFSIENEAERIKSYRSHIYDMFLIVFSVHVKQMR